MSVRTILMAASGGLAIAGLIVEGVVGQLMVVAGIQGLIGFAAAPWVRRVAATLATPPALFGFVLGIAILWIGMPPHPNPVWLDEGETSARVTHVVENEFLYEYQVDGTMCRGQSGLRRRERAGDIVPIYYPRSQPCWGRTKPYDPEAIIVSQGISVAALTPVFALSFALLFAKIGRAWGSGRRRAPAP